MAKWDMSVSMLGSIALIAGVLGIAYIANKYFKADVNSSTSMAGNDNKRGFKTKPWMTFNGTTDYFSKASTSKLQLPKFTVSVWFKTSKDYTVDGIDGMIVNKGGTGGDKIPGKQQNYGIRIFKFTNKIRAGFETSGGVDHEPASPMTVNDGKWHYVANTFDGSQVKLYMDGVLVATENTNAIPDYTNTQPLVIGKNSHDNTRYFKGDIDDVRIWNVAKTDADIKAIFEGRPVSRSGLVFESLS